MKYKNTVQSLVNIANYLDQRGQTKMADVVDHAIKIIAAEAPYSHCRIDGCEKEVADPTKGLCEKHLKTLNEMMEKQISELTPEEKKLLDQ